jgi:hypothetical protein
VSGSEAKGKGTPCCPIQGPYFSIYLLHFKTINLERPGQFCRILNIYVELYKFQVVEIETPSENNFSVSNDKSQQPHTTEGTILL